MKVISGARDLAEYGIIPLTGESCGLMYRVLYDVTAQGQRIIQRCLDVKIEFADPWNSGNPEDPHLGSIILSNEMLTPLSAFALLESGHSQCWLTKVGVVARTDKDPEAFNNWLQRNKAGRRFSQGGTAGSRNTHTFTGREM